MKGTIRYRKEIQKTYMIIEAEKKIVESYEGQMALRGGLQWLANCDVQTIDGKKEARYDISSMQTIEQIFAVREIDFQSLKDLLRQVMEAIREAENSLLDARRLCFEPEYLYWDLETGRLRVLFDYTELQEAGSLRRLAEFLLEKVCHEEERGVDLAYFFFGYVEKGTICIAEIEKYMEKQESESGEKKPLPHKEKETAPAIQESRRKEPKQYEEPEQREQWQYEKPEQREQWQYEKPEQREQWQYEKPEQREQWQYEKPEREEARRERFSWRGKNGSQIEMGLAAALTALLAGIALIGAEAYFILTKIEKMVGLGASAMLFAGGMCVFLYGFIAEKKRIKKDREREEETGIGAEQYSASEETARVYFEEKAMPEETDGRTVYIGDSLSYREYKLVQEKRGTEAEYPVSVYPFLIGKDKERVSLPVRERSVSRIHARLIREAEDVYIEDLHSTNGTYLNDLRLTPHEPVKVRRGDFIQFGKAEFVLR